MSKESNLVVLPGGKRSSFGISELIQSGILVTLLAIAYQAGEFTKELRMSVNDHEKRISKIEEKYGF